MPALTLRYITKQFLFFGFKQAYACLFGGLLLFAILLTSFVWPEDFVLPRYDFLFLFAILIQLLFVMFKLENWEEVKVILIFHLVGTVMEIFKMHAGSWVYPEENFIRIGGVPLFSGFMYSAVGSYLARVWRIFDFRFTHYPAKNYTVLLCVLIYINFFSHHYIVDFRYALLLFTALLYFKTWVHFRPDERHFKMPLLLGFSLVALFIWFAENLGTFGRIWIYPSQAGTWHMVSFTKMISWFLLMIISFVLVTLIHGKTEPGSRVDLKS